MVKNSILSTSYNNESTLAEKAWIGPIGICMHISPKKGDHFRPGGFNSEACTGWRGIRAEEAIRLRMTPFSCENRGSSRRQLLLLFMMVRQIYTKLLINLSSHKVYLLLPETVSSKITSIIIVSVANHD
jgi:hypothetical protein